MLKRILGMVPVSLPVNQTEFEAFYAKAQSLSGVPETEDSRLVIARLIMQQQPHVARMPLNYFADSLRKGASNDTVYAYIEEERKRRVEKQKSEQAQAVAEAVESQTR